MSVQVVIIRCDEPGCGNTADTTHPVELAGWLLVQVPLGERTQLSFDYCSKHAGDHK